MLGYQRRKVAQGAPARAVRDVVTRDVLYQVLQAGMLVVQGLVFRTCHELQVYYGQFDKVFSSHAVGNAKGFH